MENDKLTEYKAKRDFRQTREPSSQDALNPPPVAASSSRSTTPPRLHYDLRLELHGVFKSWVVTKGPSLPTPMTSDLQ
jgi:bifunctional non-homologous end joining protein LigD